jgi:hypothetical protein
MSLASERTGTTPPAAREANVQSVEAPLRSAEAAQVTTTTVGGPVTVTATDPPRPLSTVRVPVRSADGENVKEREVPVAGVIAEKDPLRPSALSEKSLAAPSTTSFCALRGVIVQVAFCPTRSAVGVHARSPRTADDTTDRLKAPPALLFSVKSAVSELGAVNWKLKLLATPVGESSEKEPPPELASETFCDRVNILWPPSSGWSVHVVVDDGVSCERSQKSVADVGTPTTLNETLLCSPVESVTTPVAA